VNLRIEQGQGTRQHIIEVATGLFAVRGYEGTSIEAVLAEAGLSRGALYHHFSGKAALFDAVLEATEARIARLVATAAAIERNPRDALRAGCLAWLRLSEDPAAQQIALIDAPAVVGWDRWREIDATHAFGMLRAGIQAIAAQSELPAHVVEPIAYMLNAALLELAIYVSRAPDVHTALTTAIDALDELLNRLFPNRTHSGAE
jgi:AcrR family transcriptional regulator